ncbi:hypothetical protein TKK_0002124 [Trichogramma kaykai]|uniref:Ankyrin repeat domain-containing protein 49 n=1 Tax=Trichogramma kaykai TaxID=54128 RepID=A0ABD2XBZ3_9HYME
MSSDEENDELMDLEAIRDKIISTPQNERMQVSAWDNDDDGVDDSRDAKDPTESAILTAAEEGQLDKVKEFYKLNKTLIKCQDKDGYTPLHRACYGNHTNVAEFLLESGAKIDAQTQDGWQPLHSACCWNNVDCAAMLIAHGADVNAKSKGDQTPLHLVSSASQNAPCLQLLLLNPEIDASLVNSSGDTAYDIAKRTGKHYPMFEMTEPCMNEI